MDSSNWKQRLGRIPVLGQLARALRGVYSLPVWRDQLRQDIAQAHAHCAALAQADEAAMRRIDAVTQRLEESARRIDTLERAVQERLERHEQARMRQADVAAGLERRLHAMEADLLHALRSVRQLQLHAITGAGAPAADAILPRSEPLAAPVRLEDGAIHASPHFAPYAHILEPLTAREGTQALHLHDSAPAAWLDSLAARADAGLALITALGGAEDADAAPIESLFDAALGALAPGGVLILQLPNPENLAVAAELLLAEPPARAWTPARAERLARLAGYAEVAVLRFGADAPADCAELPARDGETLSHLLHGPRQYAIVARRGA